MVRSASFADPVDALTTRTVSEICRFLLARVDEDEAAARKVSRANGGQDAEAGCEPGSPARVRRDCDARRHLIGTLQQLIRFRDQPWEAPVRAIAGQALLDLATCHRHHRAYSERWAAVIVAMQPAQHAGRPSA